MRCPKCGYITFDHLEICPKCKKNIAKISEQLSGNIFKAEAPAFLQFEVEEPEIEAEASVDIPGEADDVDLEVTFEGDDIPDVEFSFEGEEAGEDDTPVADGFDEETEDSAFQENDLEETPGALGTFDESDDDLVFEDDDDFSGFDLEEELEEPEEHADEGEDDSISSVEEDLAGVAADAEVKEGTDGQSDLQIDFSDLDIADLAPPETEEKEAVVEGLAAEAESPATTTASEPTPSRGTSGGGLEDLLTDGLDLDLPSSSSPQKSASGEKTHYTGKTGTALDDFDVDLDDLIVDKEK